MHRDLSAFSPSRPFVRGIQFNSFLYHPRPRSPVRKKNTSEPPCKRRGKEKPEERKDGEIREEEAIYDSGNRDKGKFRGW
jgi:hypothetical protein